MSLTVFQRSAGLRGELAGLCRVRRLGDRFEGTSDGELAREQRARRLSAEFLLLGLSAR